MGPFAFNLGRLSALRPATKDRITFNMCQSGVDTYCAKESKNKPRPMFLTNGGNYTQQRRAKRLNMFSDGLFHENNGQAMMRDQRRDSMVWGDGIIHVYNENNRCKWERVHPTELLVDEIEAFYGEPRQMHRAKLVDRQILVKAFEESEYGKESDRAAMVRELRRVQPMKFDDVVIQKSTSDMLQVVESWHLPSHPEADDGMVLVTCGDIILNSRDWKRDHFPFAKLAWTPRVYGYWAQGAVEQLQSIQLEINRLLWVIQRSMYLAGSFKVFLERGSKIVREQINNEIGAVVTYVGKTPVYAVPPIVAEEMYEHLERLKRYGYELLGISMLSANSEKPAGLNSGVALREYNDIESDRFMTQGLAKEDNAVVLAKLSLEVVEDIVEETGNYEVTVPGARFTQKLDWKDVKLKPTDYVTKCFPVSSLPQEPAARLETITEWVQAGWLSPRQGKRLMDLPDLEAMNSLQQAAEDNITRILDQIVDKGVFEAPSADDDLQSALELVSEYIQSAKLGEFDKTDPERFGLLQRFKVQVTESIGALNPPPPQAPPAGAPVAQPQPRPTSAILPMAGNGAGPPAAAA
jgi:hypothetical protein